MAVWLWVSELDSKNDWIELTSFSIGSPASRSGGRSVSFNDAHFTLEPGRFRMPLFNWSLRGKEKTVWVFIDPQTEYQFAGAIATSISSSSSDVMSVSINYTKVTVEYSGAP